MRTEDEHPGGRVAGKVVLITGAGRGQGIFHAQRFAEEGADVIALDLDRDGLSEVEEIVGAQGRSCFAAIADVRDSVELESAVDAGVAEFGRLDIVCPNAGVAGTRAKRTWELSPEEWKTVLDVNLQGVWATVRAAVPKVIEGGRGGSVLLIGSTTAYAGYAYTGHYTVSKHGIVGLLRVLANELGEYGIRVNAVHPTFVDTPLAHEPGMYELFVPGESPSREQFEDALKGTHILPVSMIEPCDVSNALVWLASDEARYITAVSLPVDAGAVEKT